MAHRLENNGADAIRFTADEINRFNLQAAVIRNQGTRLPAFVQAFSDVEASGKK
jgi:hypothetical protein